MAAQDDCFRHGQEVLRALFNIIAVHKGFPFFDMGTAFGCASDSTAWMPFALHEYQDDQVRLPYFFRMFCVMRKHFGNGRKVFKQLLKAARKWDADGRPAQPTADHYGNIEQAHSGKDMAESDAGGLYTGIAPSYGTMLDLGKGNFVAYEPDNTSKAALEIGRRQAGLGETVKFSHRYSAYLREQGWTNRVQGIPRMLKLEDGASVNTMEHAASNKLFGQVQ